MQRVHRFIDDLFIAGDNDNDNLIFIAGKSEMISPFFSLPFERGHPVYTERATLALVPPHDEHVYIFMVSLAPHETCYW